MSKFPYRDGAALLLIDVQNDVVEDAWHREEIIKNINWNRKPSFVRGFGVRLKKRISNRFWRNWERATYTSLAFGGAYASVIIGEQNRSCLDYNLSRRKCTLNITTGVVLKKSIGAGGGT